MRKLAGAWAITWRMTVYGVVLGIATGAIYGPISMLILYAAEVLNGRYTLLDFPISSAITYCTVAGVVGIGLGGILGFFTGTISGISLALGLLLRSGHLFGPKLYRNMIVALGVVGSSALILIPTTRATLSDRIFSYGLGVIPPFLALAVLPTAICAVSTWWASMRVVRWWEKQANAA